MNERDEAKKEMVPCWEGSTGRKDSEILLEMRLFTEGHRVCSDLGPGGASGLLHNQSAPAELT